MQKNIIIRTIWVAVLLIVIVSVILVFRSGGESGPIIVEESVIIEEIVLQKNQEIIGSSVEGRLIEVFRYGNGEKQLLFVGGIHGGYEWNSTLLAYQFIDYFEANSDFVPKNITISIIPSANPDGLFTILQKEGPFTAVDVPTDSDIALGRFNSNEIDLNRNFDCKWKSKSMWKGRVVNAGSSAFSEPEAVAIRDYILKISPETVVFWHSKADAVYASECESGVLPETINVMNAYAEASGYRPISTFDAYEITGDAEGWLASIGIPAVTVELGTRNTTEWKKNLAGITAIINLYSKE